VTGYKSIKVPLWVYQEAVALQAELVLHGIQKLPADVKFPDIDRIGLGTVLGVSVRALRARLTKRRSA
jgi:hypothetical protein